MQLSKIRHIVSLSGSRSELLKKNAIYMVFIKVFSMLIEFVKVPLVLSYLDNEVYGVWLTIVSIVLWAQNFDLGVSSGLKYKFTEFLAKGDKQGAQSIVSTAYLSFGMLLLMAFALLTPVVFCLDWNSLLNVSSIPLVELCWTVFIVLTLFFVQMFCEQISNLLQAYQKAAIADTFKPLANVFSLVLIVLLRFYTQNSLLYASIAMAAPYVLMLIGINIYLFATHFKEYAPSVKCFDKRYFRDIYALGLKYFVAQLASYVVFSSGNFLISHYLSPEDVSVYSTARTYFGLIILFNNVILIPTTTAITDAYAKNDYSWLKENMCRLVKLASLFSAGVVAMFFLSFWFVPWWTGERISIPLDLSIMLSLYAICNLYSMRYATFVAGAGKMAVSAIVNAAKIVVFIPIAIFALQKLGMSGMVWAIIIVNTLPNYIFGWIQTRKIMSGRASGIWNK